MKLVIKGAYYYNRETKTILMPHFTGEYYMVDCSTYELLEEIKNRYDKNYIDTIIDSPIEFEGKKYYSTEYSPISIDDNWELLSDLSELEHQEEKYNF